MHTCCGTPHYVAPEVLTSNGIGSGEYDHYGYHVDYWSLGVIVYIMLSGKQPFNSRSINAMYQLIIQGSYKFDSQVWEEHSADAKDIIKSLICVDIQKRMTYDTLIKHAWITRYVDEKKLIKEEEAYLQEVQQIMKQHDVETSNETKNSESNISSIVPVPDFSHIDKNIKDLNITPDKKDNSGTHVSFKNNVNTNNNSNNNNVNNQHANSVDGIHANGPEK